MQRSHLLAAVLPAALALAGCSGSSNNFAAGTVTPTPTPSAFPAQIAYVGNGAAAPGARSPHISSTPDTVQAYSIAAGGSITDPVAVTQLSSSSAGGTPEAIAVDPSHTHVFVVVNGDGTFLEIYPINPNGSLPSAPADTVGLTHTSASNNAEITVAVPVGAPSNTEYVYVATNTTGQLSAYSVNTTTDVPTAFTPGVSGTDIPYSLATDTTGTHLYSGGGLSHPVLTPYVINPATGALTAEATQEAGSSGPVLVVNDPAASAVYSYDENVKYLYSYSTGGGTLSAVNDTQTSATGNDLAIAPNGSAVYLSNGTNGTITGSVISGGSLGAATTTSAITGTNLIGVAVDASSQYVLTLDQTSDSVLAYPITAPGQLASPTAVPLTSGSDPVSAVFVPVSDLK